MTQTKSKNHPGRRKSAPVPSVMALQALMEEQGHDANDVATICRRNAPCVRAWLRGDNPVDPLAYERYLIWCGKIKPRQTWEDYKP